jgi:hypothetical protein
MADFCQLELWMIYPEYKMVPVPELKKALLMHLRLKVWQRLPCLKHGVLKDGVKPDL